MTQKEIAALIPQSYIDEIIATNVINEATATVYDHKMNYLAIVWHDFVDPNVSTTCNVCMADILKNWHNLQATLLLMKKDTNLLNSLK